MTEPVPTMHLVVTPTATDPGEAQLANDVGNLWQIHSQAQSLLTKSRAEMKMIRGNLSHRLYELKSVLARPGRAGAWSSFLAAEKIPRSSADRLVRAHAKTLSIERNNCLSEHITEPVEATVRRYLLGLWPRLSRVLTTPEGIEIFIIELRQIAEKSFAGDSQM